MRFRRPLQQYRRLPEADAEKRAFHGVLFRLLVGALVNRYCSITPPPPPPPPPPSFCTSLFVQRPSTPTAVG